MKITSDAHLYTLNVTSWKEHLKSCLKLNQTGRLPADPDTDALYYTVIVQCWAGLESVTRSLPNLAALQLVCNDGGGGVHKNYGATQKGTEEAVFVPQLEGFCRHPLEIAEIQICSTPQWHSSDKRGFPFPSTQSAHFLCNLLKIRYDFKTLSDRWLLRSSTPLASYLTSPSQ